MNISRTLAVARKEARQIVRDSRSLYLALGIPLLLMVLFGYALSLDVDNIPLSVWDQANTPESREIVSQLTASGYFTLVSGAQSTKPMIRGIDQNLVNVALVIPYDFSRRIKKGKTTYIQAIVDGSDSTRAGIAIVYLETIIGGFSLDHQTRELTRQAVRSRIAQPLEPRIRLLVQP